MIRDEQLYLDAVRDFDAGKLDDALWAKHLVKARSDERFAKASYVEEVVARRRAAMVKARLAVARDAALTPASRHFSDFRNYMTREQIVRWAGIVACLAILAGVWVALERQERARADRLFGAAVAEAPWEADILDAATADAAAADAAAMDAAAMDAAVFPEIEPDNEPVVTQ